MACKSYHARSSRLVAICTIFFLLVNQQPTASPLFPYTTLFRSFGAPPDCVTAAAFEEPAFWLAPTGVESFWSKPKGWLLERSEEHTSELQSQSNIVCRLLLEKKKKKNILLVLTHRRSVIDNKSH